MIRLAVSVEGGTEENFVKKILAGHLQQVGGLEDVQPIILGRARAGRASGGNVTVERLVRDMAHLLKSFNAVTSLVDFYGFKEKGDNTADELTDMVHRGVKKRTGANDEKIIPYIQVHEFEGLLFSDVDAFRVVEGADSHAIGELRKIRLKFRTPEEINDNWDTAPSRRISGVLRRYSKLVDGPMIAETAGLKTMRTACPRFNAWVSKLEKL